MINYSFNFSENWKLVSRIVAALFGGFLLTITSSMLLSQLFDMFGMDRINASLTAMLLSFAIYTAIVIWFFAIASVKKVWKNLLWGLMITGSLVWLIRFWSLS
jgi:Na+/H+-translocating membrane pyrophosphatase